MRRAPLMTAVLLVSVIAVAWPREARAQEGFEKVTGKEFDSAMPKDFYLEGNAIPTEKRNTTMLKTASGARVLWGLIDTSGYSSQIQQKYIGMLITESKLAVCGKSIGIGSYGFGLEKPAGESDENGKFFLYDQAGGKVAECVAQRDAKIVQPKPLQVIIGKSEAKLYLGRYFVGIKQ
jgi:hypothetical protein